MFIISEVGRRILALKEASDHRDNVLMACMLRYELKGGAGILRTNAVFCLLHETKMPNHRIIKTVSVGMGLWTSSGSTFC